MFVIARLAQNSMLSGINPRTLEAKETRVAEGGRYGGRISKEGVSHSNSGFCCGSSNDGNFAAMRYAAPARSQALQCIGRAEAAPRRMTAARTKIVLPPGLTPRLLSRDQAAAYCGMSPGLFQDTIGREVHPVDIRGRRILWDLRALDRWIDRQSKLTDLGNQQRSIEERLNGYPGAGC